MRIWKTKRSRLKIQYCKVKKKKKINNKIQKRNQPASQLLLWEVDVNTSDKDMRRKMVHKYIIKGAVRVFMLQR